MNRDDPVRLPDYLSHILNACARIALYVQDLDETGFTRSPITQDAVIRNVEVVGEASRNVTRYYPDFAAQHPDVPWEDAYRMRNRVSHGYFTIDLSVVWILIQRDIPELAVQIKGLYQNLAAD